MELESNPSHSGERHVRYHCATIGSSIADFKIYQKFRFATNTSVTKRQWLMLNFVAQVCFQSFSVNKFQNILAVIVKNLVWQRYATCLMSCTFFHRIVTLLDVH